MRDVFIRIVIFLCVFLFSPLSLWAGGKLDSCGKQMGGVINLSVATLCEKPDFSSEMMTQALLGMPVRVIEQGDWYRIQTPDEYVAWVHRVGVYLTTPAELRAWNDARKVVVTSLYGVVYSRPDACSQTISDVVAGNRLKWEGEEGDYYKVSYPDGRVGYIGKTLSMLEDEWRAGIRQDAESVLHTAFTLMGIPYIWAGTSTKGMDCSGFVRTVLFMHDIIIPRDASQQARVGERIEIAPDFGNLLPGDLVFFGRKATGNVQARVVHVGIYLGEKRFIHSQGDVHVSSFDPADPLFDAFNLGRLLFAARVLPYINKAEEINTTVTNPYYQSTFLEEAEE